MVAPSCYLPKFIITKADSSCSRVVALRVQSVKNGRLLFGCAKNFNAPILYSFWVGFLDID